MTDDQLLWDEKSDRDSMEGRLDFLFEEADEEADFGPLREWPPLEERIRHEH